MRAVAKLITVLVLVLSLGLHWALLQTVAWTGMLVSYSRDGSFATAVSKTFDGKHPCCMCKAIESGRQEEQKQSPDKLAPDAKIKGALPAETVWQYAPVTIAALRITPALAPTSHLTEPPTPPPRFRYAV